MDDFTTALELATDEELCQIAEILFHRRFNPLDYVLLPQVVAVQSLDRQALIQKIVRRFRFLAADGFMVIQCKTGALSYRQVLGQVCHFLKIRYNPSQTNAEIESELFLHLLQRSWKKLPAVERAEINAALARALEESELGKSLPPIAYRQPLDILARGSSVLAVNAMVKPLILNLLARQVAWHFATYQAGKEALKAGGTAIANRFQAYFTTKLAQQGMTVAAARYAAARTAFALLTPTLWGLFFADLGWRAIATNYGRVIPVIFILAQIRLLRTEG